MKTKEISDLVKLQSEKVLNKSYSLRSERSGFIYQCIINNLYQNNYILTNDTKEQIRKLVRHSNAVSIDFYYRAFIMKFLAKTSIFDNTNYYVDDIEKYPSDNNENQTPKQFFYRRLSN